MSRCRACRAVFLLLLLMATPPQQNFSDVWKRAVKESTNFLRDSFDSLTGGRAAWVATGNPRSVTGKAAQQATRRQCEVWGKNPGAFRAAWGEQLRDLCGDYLDSKGLSVPDSKAVSPYLGGQCECARYQAAFNLIQGGTGNLIGSPSFRTRGPITGARIDGNGALRVTTRGSLGAVNQAYPSCQPTASEKRIGTNNYPEGTTVASLFIIDAPDGDDCGDPPPEFDPGNGYAPALPSAPRLDPLDPSSPEITVTVNPDGSVTFCAGEDCITVQPGPDGEAPDGEEGGGADDLPPGDQGSEDTVDTNVDDVSEGQCQAGNLVGVLVAINSKPPRSNRFFNSVEAYTKGAYFVYFGGEAGFSQNPEAAIVKDEQFFFAPENCNKWRVVANTGYTLTVTSFCRED